MFGDLAVLVGGFAFFCGVALCVAGLWVMKAALFSLNDRTRAIEPAYAAANPMIAAAIEAGEDATGLCTVRSVAAMLIAAEERRRTGEGKSGVWETPLACETAFRLPSGYQVNVEIHVTSVVPEKIE